MLLTLKRLARRLLGVDAVLRQVAAAESRGRRGLLLLGNAVRYAREDPAALRALPDYRNVAAVIGLLRPCAVQGTGFVRIGAGNDGGYVMLDALAPPRTTVAYSCGIGNDVSWDLAIAERGIGVWLYDHTVSRPPASHPRFHFSRTGLTGRAAHARCRTLGTLLADNGHADRDDMVLKMDIEGCEWDVLAETSSATLDRFGQIVVEFHDLAGVLDPVVRPGIVAVLAKLNATHQVIHVHGNGGELPIWIGDLVLPQIVEVTYVRRRDHQGRFVPHAGPFPTALDRPNQPGSPDVFLGRFDADG